MKDDTTHDDESSSSRKRRSRNSEQSAKFEEDVKALAGDDAMIARELLLLKKEMSRLHYKVKTYHNQTRIVNGIINTVIIGLLLVIVYQLFT